ncbi:CIC11C00000003143 [Sungouiella intermedia]|uniref:CIC11C00000003143 n=1 Tax=Sungouiella intermedia TaxID=45354 RepID=A0A1L0BNU4_9ASCO|nr:CIC11C00000003143 [[Candida] intermedia]
MSRFWRSNLEKKETTEVKVNDFESISSSEKQYDHIFQDPEALAYYRALYEKTNYECKDHLDPDLTWTPEEEKKILRRNDWYVTFWAFIMFTGLNLDRFNIKNALADNLLDDLNLNTNDLNLANTVNLICFLSAELPSQLISKKLGADVWIPIQMCIWSVVSMAQFWLNGKTSFVICRALIGLFEGGFICDVTLWMSYFYTKSELPLRISLFYISNFSSVILSALLAAGLLEILTPSVPEGWRWLFMIEGIITLLIGIASFFFMPASVVDTKAWYRKKGWYTDREEKILVNKVLRDDPSKGDMNNRQPVGLKELAKAFFDIDMLPVYIIRLLGDIGTLPVATYLSLTLRQLGFSVFSTNMLSIPFSIIGIVSMVLVTWLSEVWNSRAYIIMITPIWVAVCLLPLRYWAQAQEDVWGTYALLTILLGHAPIWPLTISWCMANSNSVRSRAVSSAVVNMFSQTAGIISANIYRDDDKPLYHRGNVDLIGIAFGAIGACIAAKYYYVFRNWQNKKKWDAMTPEEQDKYLATTTDEGNKRIDFRFIY